MLIANGNPKELFAMLSAFILKNEKVEIIQEIDDFLILLLLIARCL